MSDLIGNIQCRATELTCCCFFVCFFKVLDIWALWKSESVKSPLVEVRDGAGPYLSKGILLSGFHSSIVLPIAFNERNMGQLTGFWNVVFEI